MFKSQPPFPAGDTLLNSLGATMEEQPTANTASYRLTKKTPTTPSAKTPTHA